MSEYVLCRYLGTSIIKIRTLGKEKKIEAKEMQRRRSGYFKFVSFFFWNLLFRIKITFTKSCVLLKKKHIIKHVNDNWLYLHVNQVQRLL